MELTVVDYSNGRLTPEQVKNAGHSGAIRYLPKKGGSTVSVLNAAEVAAYEHAEMPLGLVYEDPTPGWMLGGHVVGRDRAQWCLAKCAELGIRPRAIYLADDAQHDAAGTAQVMACLDGARSILGAVTGLYGFRSSIQAAVATGRAHWYWLTGHKPTTEEIRSLHLNLYQHNYDSDTIAGIQCDISDVFTQDWGQLNMGLTTDEHNALMDLKDQMNGIYRLTTVGDAPDAAGDPGTHPFNLEAVRKQITQLATTVEAFAAQTASALSALAAKLDQATGTVTGQYTVTGILDLTNTPK